MNFTGTKEDEQELCEWLKDHVVRYINTSPEGRRKREIRDHFTKLDRNDFKTSNENWNSTPLELKKFIFRLAMEQLTKDGLIRVRYQNGLLHHETRVVMNDVLDIMSRIK